MLNYSKINFLVPLSTIKSLQWLRNGIHLICHIALMTHFSGRHPPRCEGYFQVTINRGGILETNSWVAISIVKHSLCGYIQITIAIREAWINSMTIVGYFLQLRPRWSQPALLVRLQGGNLILLK